MAITLSQGACVCMCVSGCVWLRAYSTIKRETPDWNDLQLGTCSSPRQSVEAC